jgi:hypothetical protein
MSVGVLRRCRSDEVVGEVSVDLSTGEVKGTTLPMKVTEKEFMKEPARFSDGCHQEQKVASDVWIITLNCLTAALPTFDLARVVAPHGHSTDESIAKFKGGHMHMPPFDGAGVPSLSYIVRYVVVTLARLGSISTSSHVLVLKCGLNNWKRISSGLDMQNIGKATELKRKRRLPSSDEEEP